MPTTLAELIEEVPGGVHLVGYSYGGLGVCIAAERLPHRVRSPDPDRGAAVDRRGGG